jgi:hypothetical protein
MTNNKKRVRFAYPEIVTPEDVSLNGSSNHSSTRWEELHVEEEEEEEGCSCENTTQHQHHQQQHHDDRYLPPRMPQRKESVEIPLDLLLDDTYDDDQQQQQHEQQAEDCCEPCPILVKESRYMTTTRQEAETKSHRHHEYYNPIKDIHSSPICVVDTNNIEE